MKHPYRRRLLYFGFCLMRGLAQRLPAAMVRSLGRMFGAAAYAVLGSHRRQAHEHLAMALPGIAAGQRRRIARGVFRNLGLTVVEWLRLPRMSHAQLQQLIDCEGLDHLRRALASGNGAIVISAHFGNWELIALYLRGLGFEGGVLARRLRYPEYESFLIGMRGDKGVPTLARGSLKEVARLLRDNQIIGLMPDQDVDSLEGVFVNFFGQPAYTPAGPAALALMTGAPILPCFMIRQGARFRLVIEPPVPLPQTRDRSQGIQGLTQAWSDIVAGYIQRYPDHWVWMHRRWKTQPPAPGTQQPAASGQQPMSGTLDSLQGKPLPVFSCVLLAGCCWLAAALGGCAKSGSGRPAGPNDAAAPQADQRMSAFTLAGYDPQGGKQWTLEGEGATVEGDLVTIRRPTAVGYDAARTAYLSASTAQVQQATKKIRLEHDVTVHTSDGLWLTSPVLHWLPNEHQMTTEEPVRIETDHMLIRGRGASGLTELKQATLLRDIEVVLNPADNEPLKKRSHVTITCDGPLSFDYDRNIAVFERNVRVQDPNGDLYADTLVAHLNASNHTIRYAEATGRVRIMQNQNTAYSDRAIYEPARGTITLVGKPSLVAQPDATAPALPMGLGGLAAPMPPPPEPAASATGE